MEPRPPRPRQQYLSPEPGAAAARQGTRPGEGLYPPPPGGYAAPPYPPELDLLPRQERHRQRIARNVLLVLLALVAVGALAWFVRDRFFPTVPPTQVAQLAPTSPAQAPVAAVQGSPAATTTATLGDDPAPGAAANNLLSTSTPTPPSAAAPTAAAGNTAAPANDAPAATEATDAPAAAAIDLEALLPTEDQLPVSGLPMTDSGDRTLAAVLATFGSEEAQADADARLEEWGWRANVYRNFSIGDPTLISPSDISAMTVSIHQFADQAAASEALEYFSNVLIAAGAEDVMADPIGDGIRLMREVTEDGTTNVAAYVVDGPLLYRIGGSSPAGDPTESVLLLANSLIGGQ